MKFSELIAAFAAHYGMDDLVVSDDNTTGFMVDHRAMTLQLLPESETALAAVELGEASEAATANLLLLKANQTLFALDGLTLGVRDETEHYCLFDRIDISNLDVEGFDARLARLLTRAGEWGAFLDAFVPLATAADGHVKDEEPVPHHHRIHV